MARKNSRSRYEYPSEVLLHQSPIRLIDLRDKPVRTVDNIKHQVLNGFLVANFGKTKKIHKPIITRESHLYLTVCN